MPTGGYKVRANDTEYRFRPGTEFAHLVGSHEPDAVLVVDPDGEAVLYQAPTMDRSTPAFFTDRMYGELWVGPRPSLASTSALLGIETRPLEELDKLAGTRRPRRARATTPASRGCSRPTRSATRELTAFLSELRLVKDDHEIAQLQAAVDATVLGFEDVVRRLGEARATSERYIEGVFGLRARVEGNDVGYGSICAAGSHACTLHWTDNDGPVRDGDLVLLDMGVEGHELYTADVTRTLPVERHASPRASARSTTSSSRPRRRRSRPAGRRRLPRPAPRRDARARARAGRASACSTTPRRPSPRTTSATGAGRCTASATCSASTCTTARTRATRRTAHGTLAVGPRAHRSSRACTSSPTTSPVPEDLRGIGVRIEDDVVVTADGCRNLSAALPRSSRRRRGVDGGAARRAG